MLGFKRPRPAGHWEHSAAEQPGGREPWVRWACAWCERLGEWRSTGTACTISNITRRLSYPIHLPCTHLPPALPGTLLISRLVCSRSSSTHHSRVTSFRVPSARANLLGPGCMRLCVVQVRCRVTVLGRFRKVVHMRDIKRLVIGCGRMGKTELRAQRLG